MSFDLQQSQAGFIAALRNGDESAAQAVIAAARAAGVEPGTIYLKLLASGMITIGELWERNELSVAEEHLATEITERLIGQISPWFSERTPPNEHGRVVMGCVAGERHALGLRMLADLFRHQGWRVLYLGADVPHGDWVRLVVRFNADLVAISASAERHMPQTQELIRELRAANPQIEVLVGGACFDRDPELWRRIGATQYHPDPLTAVTLASARYATNAARQAEQSVLTSKQ
ncbi:MAG TPA: cobalamin-dependent protein [Herpetosiphonaceae bacterium]